MSCEYRSLHLFIEQVAERFSCIRRANYLYTQFKEKVSRISDISSTKDEIFNDWKNACIFITINFMEGGMPFLDVKPNSYFLIENVWLEEIKQFKAYCIWENGLSNGREKDYLSASAELRSLFINSAEADINEFNIVKEYIKNNFLSFDLVLDENKIAVKNLLNLKANRLSNIDFVGNARYDVNLERAKMYSKMFYENIIPAIEFKNKNSILELIKFFQIGKSFRNNLDVINAFEVIIAALFLDKKIVRNILMCPELYNFNIELVDGWTCDVNSICNGKMWYDDATKQLIYEGVMNDDELNKILNMTTDLKTREAVKNVYLLSRLAPFSEMIL